METFATGLKWIKTCDEAGCQVEFRTETDDFVVVFYRNLRQSWGESSGFGADDANNGANDANHDANREADTLMKKILDAIKRNPKISQNNLATELKTLRRTIWSYDSFLSYAIFPAIRDIPERKKTATNAYNILFQKTLNNCI